MKKITYNQNHIQFARKLRKEGTLAEVLLWQQIKGRQIKGYKFTRQKPIGNYIVDFYCSRLHLAIEIDGSSHENKLGADQKRQKDIEKQGVKFLRFWDHDVKNNMNGVITVIIDWVEKEEHRTGVKP